jgi:hypothetical protein
MCKKEDDLTVCNKKGHLLNLNAAQLSTFRASVLAVEECQQPPHCDLVQRVTASTFVRGTASPLSLNIS